MKNRNLKRKLSDTQKKVDLLARASIAIDSSVGALGLLRCLKSSSRVLNFIVLTRFPSTYASIRERMVALMLVNNKCELLNVDHRFSYLANLSKHPCLRWPPALPTREVSWSEARQRGCHLESLYTIGMEKKKSRSCT